MVMLRSSVSRWVLGLVALVAVLGIIRFKPWQRLTAPGGGETASARERLNVGFLPVT
jgi:hypothetical protein